MKERLNLTIDGELLDAMKVYAASKQMSVSELVENYFRSVTRPVQRKNILDLVDELEKPVLDGKAEWPGSFEGKTGLPESFDGSAGSKELFYKGQEKKYGF
ncbi:MAG TPA: DUF6364 family protein [Puia sp.]